MSDLTYTSRKNTQSCLGKYFLLTIVGSFLYFSNPSEADMRAYIRDQEGMLTWINKLHVKDFTFFSIHEVDIGLFQHRHRVFLGVAGLFIELK